MTKKTVLGFEAWVMRVQRCTRIVYSKVRESLEAAATYSKILWQSRLSEYMKIGMTSRSGCREQSLPISSEALFRDTTLSVRHKFSDLGFEILTTMTRKCTIFWDVMP
jgi:hypothetical protein